jgi:type IV secretion system protein VirB9
VFLGDSVRWWAIPSTGGSKEQSTPHVIVKVREKGISTNLIITTDRRFYELNLIEGGKPESRVGFWYPEEEAALAAKQVQVEIKPQRVEHERYSVKGSYPWTPRRVYDDGTRTFLELPPESRVTSLPVLFVTDQGKKELVNYGVQWPLITVGRLFEKAELVLGTGWGQERVEIRRTQ